MITGGGDSPSPPPDFLAYTGRMQRVLAGFTNELIKLSSSSHRDPHDKPQRDYMSSMLIGALSTPIVALMGKTMGRYLENRGLQRALRGAHGLEREGILGEMHTGPIIGRFQPGLGRKQRPLMTYDELLTDMTKGAIGGSILQMIRDHFASKRQEARAKNSRG